MTTAAIERPRFDSALSTQIDQWVERALSSYIASNANNRQTQSKQIHDPIAGTIRVSPHELYILDSPILQRLRCIRQLGVGHVLFPSSGYSRFEHSLGAIHTATQVFDALVAAQQETPSPIYQSDEFVWRRHVVRLAALLHDVGHCVFSHVSEKFYEQYAPLNEARDFLRKYYGCRVSASETVTLLILQSPAFQDLLVRSRAAHVIGKPEETIIESISACIAGSKSRLAPDAFLAEIVNGPVDCDKLDYIARDAYTAGIPIALDTKRLISKLRLVSIESEDTKQRYNSLAILMSGTRALDELLISRLFLFDKFYYHAKVMSAEEAVRSGLRSLARAIPDFISPVTLLDLADDELLHLTAQDYAARYGADLQDENVMHAVKVFDRVRRHDLPKRAFAFAVRYMSRLPSLLVTYEFEGNAEESASENEVEFKHLGRDLEDTVTAERIALRLKELCAELGVNGDVFISHQVAERVTKATHLPVLMAGGVVERHPPFLFKSHEWTEAYALNRATSYVFGYTDLEKVHIAAERLLLEHRPMPHFAPNCALVAKLSMDRVDQFRKDLPKGWLGHRLRQDYLRTAAAKDRIDALRDKFSSYLNSFEKKVASRLVHAWLSQFPNADLQESALRLLEHITFVEQSDVLDGFRALVAADDDIVQAQWIPFLSKQSPGKSADVLVADLKPMGVQSRKIGELDAEAIRTRSRVVFFDDALNTGTQATTLLRSWFGASDDELDAPSDRDHELPGDIQQALRDTPITFIFYAVHDRGRESLAAVASSLRLGAGKVRILQAIDSTKPAFTLDGLVCDTQESKEQLLEFMREKGTMLLRARADAKKWPQDQARRYALGFSELRSTMAFRHSVSTAVPAVLWEHQLGPTRFWLPLFPRDRETVRNALAPQTSRTADEDLPVYGEP